MKAGSPRKGTDITRGLPGSRQPTLTVETSYESPICGPGKAFPGQTLKEVPRNPTMRHAFVAKRAMFALLMLSFRLNVTDNFETIGRTLKGVQEMVWKMTALWGPTQYWGLAAQVPSLWQTCSGEKYHGLFKKSTI